jgi:hypothetical protein
VGKGKRESVGMLVSKEEGRREGEKYEWEDGRKCDGKSGFGHIACPYTFFAFCISTITKKTA